MSVKDLVLAKAESLGIHHVEVDRDTAFIEARADKGHALRVSMTHVLDGKPTKGVVDVPFVRANSWAEMLKLLKKVKQVKEAA